MNLENYIPKRLSVLRKLLKDTDEESTAAVWYAAKIDELTELQTLVKSP